MDWVFNSGIFEHHLGSQGYYTSVTPLRHCCDSNDLCRILLSISMCRNYSTRFWYWRIL